MKRRKAKKNRQIIIGKDHVKARNVEDKDEEDEKVKEKKS